MFSHFIKDSWKEKAIGTRDEKMRHNLKIGAFFHSWGRKENMNMKRECAGVVPRVYVRVRVLVILLYGISSKCDTSMKLSSFGLSLEFLTLGIVEKK